MTAHTVSSTSCTTLPALLASMLEVTAAAVDTPRFWKKRVVIAMVPRPPGAASPVK
jgi:hypothetical protein